MLIDFTKYIPYFQFNIHIATLDQMTIVKICHHAVCRSHCILQRWLFFSQLAGFISPKNNTVRAYSYENLYLFMLIKRQGVFQKASLSVNASYLTEHGCSHLCRILIIALCICLNTYIDNRYIAQCRNHMKPITVLPTLVQYYFIAYITHNAFGCFGYRTLY